MIKWRKSALILQRTWECPVGWCVPQPCALLRKKMASDYYHSPNQSQWRESQCPRAIASSTEPKESEIRWSWQWGECGANVVKVAISYLSAVNSTCSLDVLQNNNRVSEGKTHRRKFVKRLISCALWIILSVRLSDVIHIRGRGRGLREWIWEGERGRKSSNFMIQCILNQTQCDLRVFHCKYKKHHIKLKNKKKWERKGRDDETNRWRRFWDLLLRERPINEWVFLAFGVSRAMFSCPLSISIHNKLLR